MLVKVIGGGWRGSRERVFAVQDRNANVVKGFTDLEHFWLNVGAVVLWSRGEIQN